MLIGNQCRFPAGGRGTLEILIFPDEDKAVVFENGKYVLTGMAATNICSILYEWQRKTRKKLEDSGGNFDEL